MYKFWTVDVLRFVTIFFTISVFISMFFYPGGNIHDPLQEGYSFSHNFLSDLGGYKSHSGLPNLTSFLIFNFSMTLFILIGVSFLFMIQAVNRCANRITQILKTEPTRPH